MKPELGRLELKKVTVCANPSVFFQVIVAPAVALIVPGTKVESFIRTVQEETQDMEPGDSFWHGIRGSQKKGLLLRCALLKAEATSG